MKVCNSQTHTINYNISQNYNYCTTITEQVTQLILTMLVRTDVCVRVGGNRSTWR